MKKNQDKGKRNADSSAELESDGKLFLDKTLSSALDSFDTIFCRRCLVGFSHHKLTLYRSRYP